MTRQTFIILGAVIALALAAAGYFFLPAPGTTVQAAAPTGPAFTILPSDRTLGSPKAPVTVIEYGAPSCPVCAAFNHDSFALLRRKYIDTGKVFYVFRVFPLRPDDGAAEKIARCLPEDKYFAFIDLLFRNQPKWDVEYGVLDVHGGLVQLGRIAGMSAEQVDACMANKAEDDRINKVAQDGATRYHISGTPTFVVNGVPQPAGNMPWPDMQKILDAALAAKNKK